MIKHNHRSAKKSTALGTETNICWARKSIPQNAANEAQFTQNT